MEYSMTTSVICMKCIRGGHPESDRKKYGDHHHYRPKKQKTPPKADYPELDDPLSLARWIIEFEFFDPKNRHMNAQQLAEIYANKIQALMIRERLDELRSLLNHCLEAFEPNSQGYALTVPELEERIEHLSASAGKKS